MSTDPHLLAVATAVPAYELQSPLVMEQASRLFAPLGADFARMLPIFGNSGIETRYSCMPLDWYGRPVGWKERNQLYLDHATALGEEAARKCLDAAGMSALDVDAVVCVSSTGIATPSLDARLVGRMSLRPDVIRVPLFGLGCAGGALGLARAAHLARGQPGSKVLLVVVELCALTFRSDDMSKSNIVATALFGDGAAAALLSMDGEGPAVTAWGEHIWANSLDVMGWRVEDDGLGVVFSRDIPSIVRRDLRPALDGFLAKHALVRGDINRFICHPGGAKVVAALEQALDLLPGVLEAERDVLRGYGNMSAATVLFVLERARTFDGRSLLTAMGPGFSAGFVVLEG